MLAALAHRDSYGYGLMKTVEDQSGGRLSPDVGSLYRVLARLMADGLVEERPRPDDVAEGRRGRPRRYYGLTTGGRELATAEARRMAELVDLARSRALLGGGGSS